MAVVSLGWLDTDQGNKNEPHPLNRVNVVSLWETLEGECRGRVILIFILVQFSQNQPPGCMKYQKGK